ncbi:RadC family protein [Candidatus Fukatsuia endosymbiont of Tuberolachnus salignus]|uniref:RadC family protein n=1 Tax=Candidatus Fukatsuia endosymbiont of Tuberolachnus salignus TaxID=3077957 RepID=UPI00313CDE1E
MDRWSGVMPPREKLLKFGAVALTDTELLAIFLRTGMSGLHVVAMAENLVTEFGSLYSLMSADYQTLCAQKGMGKSKYTQIQAISELARRCSASYLAKESALCNTKVTREFLQSILSHRDREIFLVMFLDNQHRVIRHEELFAGTISSVEVHPREIVREALKFNAAALILAHNHPSGRAEPSKADRLMTAQVIKACSLLDIRVLDHFVIGHGECVSFAERGWM